MGAKSDFTELLNRLEKIPDEKKTDTNREYARNCLKLLKDCDTESKDYIAYQKKGHLKENEIDDIIEMFHLDDDDNGNNNNDDDDDDGNDNENDEPNKNNKK